MNELALSYRLRFICRIWWLDLIHPVKVRLRARRWAKLGVFDVWRRQTHYVFGSQIVRGDFATMLNQGLSGALSGMRQQEATARYYERQQRELQQMHYEARLCQSQEPMQQARMLQQVNGAASQGLAAHVAAALQAQATNRKV